MLTPFFQLTLDDDCLCGIIYTCSIPSIQWVFDIYFHTSFYQILDTDGMLFCDFVECEDGLIAVLPHTWARVWGSQGRLYSANVMTEQPKNLIFLYYNGAYRGFI